MVNSRVFKLIFILAFCILLITHYYANAQQQPFQASATKTYTAETAREEAFKGATALIDTWSFPTIDPEYKLHKAAIAKKSRFVLDTMITAFDAGSYNVVKKCAVISFYYESNGQLYLIQEDSSANFSDPNECPAQNPTRALRYNFPDGKLFQAAFSPKESDDYLYSSSGDLISHWINNKCFDAAGKFCGYRKSHFEGHYVHAE